MTSQEVTAFSEIFNGLARMLMTRRFDDGERERMISDYFRALRSYQLDGVRAAAEVLAQRAKHFPKPVEWIEAIPRTDRYADVPVMADKDAREHRRAHAMGYESEPCDCHSCRSANVAHLPLRFVPDLHEDETIAMKDPDGGRVITCGHWAHGQELRRWYDAKSQCFTAAADSLQRGAMRLIGRRP